MMLVYANFLSVAACGEGLFFSVNVSVPAPPAMYRNKTLTIPVGTAGCSRPLGICMGWITPDEAGEIIDAMEVLDWNWEGHDLRKGGVITAIQGESVRTKTKSSLIELCPGLRPINLTITRSGPQEAQDGGASQPATTAWESFWCAKHQRFYWGNRETGESVWEFATPRPSPPPLAVDTLIAYNKIRKYLGGFGGRGAEHFFSLFGEPHSGTAPFGSRVWHGIRELAFRDVQLRRYPLDDMRLGWFQAPQPFSRRNAELPLERDEWWQMPYPAVFVKWDGDLWIVRCLAILLNNGRNWYTHWSRVTFITSDDDVIPPSSGPASENGLARKRDCAPQPVASSASTSTASGSSTSGSWSSAASCSDSDDADCDDDYMILPDDDDMI